MNAVIIIAVIGWSVALILTALVLWLFSAKSKVENEVKQLLKGGRKDITVEILPERKEHYEKNMFRKKHLVEIGYSVQYFVDGIPFVKSEPVFTETVDKREVDSEKIEQIMNLVLEEARNTLTGPINISLPQLHRDPP